MGGTKGGLLGLQPSMFFFFVVIIIIYYIFFLIIIIIHWLVILTKCFPT